MNWADRSPGLHCCTATPSTTTSSAPVRRSAIDPCRYYGHPELDLALVDFFTPVAPELFAACSEMHPPDPGFGARRELWRLFAYLAVLSTAGDDAWARPFAVRLSRAISDYG